MQLRSRYSYQEKPRKQITTNIREDLRNQLKNYSVNIHNPESKIYDCMINYFLNNKSNIKILTELVKNYY